MTWPSRSQLTWRFNGPPDHGARGRGKWDVAGYHVRHSQQFVELLGFSQDVDAEASGLVGIWPCQVYPNDGQAKWLGELAAARAEADQSQRAAEELVAERAAKNSGLQVSLAS
jgi:hypothetical protein